MRFLIFGILISCLSVEVCFGSSEEDALYSSALIRLLGGESTGSLAIRGLEGIDDVAGFFVDMNDDGVVDGVRLETLEFVPGQAPTVLGSRTYYLETNTFNGVRMLSFPIVEQENFTPSLADLLPGLPDGALPVVPVTEDGSIDVALADGTSILAFPVPAIMDNSNQSFQINVGLGGSWFDPETDGQGFLIEVLDRDVPFIFIAWFTYTTDGALQWYTAGGNIAGDSATLDILEASNGLFNMPTDVVRTTVGTLTIRFTDCENATIDFDFPDSGLNDTIAITRIAGDQFCQAIVDGMLVIPPANR